MNKNNNNRKQRLDFNQLHWSAVRAVVAEQIDFCASIRDDLPILQILAGACSDVGQLSPFRTHAPPGYTCLGKLPERTPKPQQSPTVTLNRNPYH